MYPKIHLAKNDELYITLNSDDNHKAIFTSETYADPRSALNALDLLAGLQTDNIVIDESLTASLRDKFIAWGQLHGDPGLANRIAVQEGLLAPRRPTDG